jgi:FAD/FMN-containing dehydrogenase
MSKIAVYLNEHILGEVSSAKSLRKKYSTDGSVLTITPEIVAFPKVTNDVRKIARFTWQLAEKGHVVPMTVRGYGGDTSGAAIGKGIVIDTSRHLNQIIQVGVKDKLVHVQPGSALDAVNTVLKWQGMTLPGALSHSDRSVSVGGAIATDSVGANGSVSDSIDRLEVVLANGDVIETGKIRQRDVRRKLGLQTFEGEIYRKLEGLLEDNDELIKQIAADPVRDNTGYKRIADVRSKDGSFNLTPLFIASQGTLGIISEVVLKTNFYAQAETHAVVSVDSLETARDLSEKLLELNPDEITIFDGDLFRRAAKQGTKFTALGSVEQIGAVVYIRLNDFKEHTQLHKLKKIRKLIQKLEFGIVDSTERDVQEFRKIASVAQSLQFGAADEHPSVPLLNGASIPYERREAFEAAMAELGSKHHVQLPLVLNVYAGTYDVHPLLHLDSVSDKQKVFKLLGEYAALVNKCGGAFVSDGAEGRLKSTAAWEVLDSEYAALYEQIRAIFDPFGTLNPGVKQKNDLRTLIAALRGSYDTASTL